MRIEAPFWLSMFFIIAALFPLFHFYRKAKGENYFNTRMNVLGIWMLLQLMLSMSHFYTDTDPAAFPPKFALMLLPAVAWIIILFATARGRNFIDSLDAKWLTWLHTVRIPVEITLYYLFVYKAVPQLMTFEGRNFDIVSGITAIPIAYYGYRKKKLGRGVLLAWNLICLALLLNIVINAILSVPSPFQKQAFEQPNIGVLNFPYTFLPSLIVPLVLFSHLACIRKLLKKEEEVSAD